MGTFKARSQKPMGSLNTVSGLIMMVNFVCFLLLMAVAMSLSWRTKAISYEKEYYDDLEDLWVYNFSSMAVPFVGYLIIQAIAICCCDCPRFKGLSDIVMMILCFILGALIIVSGIFLHLALRDKECNQQRNCQQLEASVIVGYLCAGLLFAESFFHLSEKNIVMSQM